MANNKRSGTLFVKSNGVIIEAVGNFTYRLGLPKREMMVGPDGVHGFKELPQVPFIEGEARDSDELDVAALQNTVDATITLELANGKTIVLREGAYTADGDVQTEEGNIQLRFEGKSAEEV